ncbi:shikimate dehydrogenase family protein [Lacinutrix chionoecetis]
MRRFGLIGKNIDYSFSRTYFKKKFETENRKQVTYENFDIATIEIFETQLKNEPHIKGFNVTIPYKESIIPYLDKLNKKAKVIGAVNTIKISRNGKYIGYNTDYYGFKKSIKPLLKPQHKKALILGTGGASKAIAFALKSLDIDYAFVSRNNTKNVTYTYSELTHKVIESHHIIVNCTPLGTFPNIEECPNIPYNALSKNHVLFDLIYNPSETTFLKRGKQKNATVINGFKMLELQAEKSWEIWNK